MKKTLLALCLALCLPACGDKPENNTQDAKVAETTASADNSLQFDDREYSYQKDNLSDKCASDSEIFCAIEKVVKCALKPTAAYCDKATMPDFIFYDDAMFADDDGLGRPTQQSFKLVKMKPIDGTTIEVFTTGTCDKNWFGNCAGNIIYVLSNKGGHWRVKELYAMENI